MSNFNKYAFLDDLKTLLLDEVINENLTDIDSIQDFIHEELERQVMYSRDCFEIAMDLNLTDFNDFELGVPTSIYQLAYMGLYEFTIENFDHGLIESAIEYKDEFIKFVFSDNCINVEGGKTKTQCTQYSKAFTQIELLEYYLKEYSY